MIVIVQSPRYVLLFPTPWIAASQSSSSLTISRSLPKFMSIELMMLPNHLILCHLLSFCLWSFPALGSFPMSQLFASGGQNIVTSALASVLPMSIQGWFPLTLTGLISLLFKELSRVFFSTTVQRHQFCAQPFLLSGCHIQYITAGKTIVWLYGRL